MLNDSKKCFRMAANQILFYAAVQEPGGSSFRDLAYFATKYNYLSTYLSASKLYILWKNSICSSSWFLA